MIIFRKCPCCKESIFVLKDSVCRYERNYRCYYCPKCNKQITTAKKVKPHSNIVIAMSLFAAFVILSLLPNSEARTQFVLWFIPLSIFLNLLIVFISGVFKKLSCIVELKDKDEIKRDNSDMWGSDVPFMQMDEIEKENFNKLTNVAVGFLGYGVLALIALGVVIGLIKYLVGLLQ